MNSNQKRLLKERYGVDGVEIEERRPEINIVRATRKYGIPFVSKIMSGGLSEWQKKGVPLSIADEYDQAEDKAAKRKELKERYPKCESLINFLCCCNSAGEPRPNIQLVINSSKYMRDFIKEYPPEFMISASCCYYCKKQIAHKVQKDYDMVITGERRDEGGMRSVPRKDNTALCFTETADGHYRLRPLYYVYHFCMMGVSTVTPYIAHVAQESDVLKDIFNFLDIQTSMDENEIDVLDDGEKSPWLRVYMRNGKFVYEGYLGKRELEEGKKQFISLKKYRKYILDEKGNPQKPYIENNITDDDVVVIYYDDIEIIEKNTEK